jgi:8-oxo-dGTP pyrophosphatase MutT (NUDIX family)
VALIDRIANNVLLLQRNPDAYPNYVDPFPCFWELIGGGVEIAEKPLQAAMREMLEETGIVLTRLDLVGIAPFVQRGEPANNWIYLALVDSPVDVILSQEHLAFMWVLVGEARHMQLAFKHSQILEAICSKNSF